MENKTELIYKKPNFLIRTYSSASLQENKLLALILYGLRYATKDEFGRIVTYVPKSDIDRAWNLSRSQLYRHLTQTTEKIRTLKLGYDDPKTGNFMYQNIVDTIGFEDGVLKVAFTPVLTEELESIKKNYTWLSLPVMMGFNSNYSLRLYEIIRAAAYDVNDRKRKDFYLETTVAQLKFNLGVADANESRVKAIFGKERLTDEDYERALEICKNQKFLDWRNFKKFALDVAVEEINNSPQAKMKIEIKPIKVNRKVRSIGFDVHFLENESAEDVEYPVLGLTQEEYGQIALRAQVSLDEAKIIAEEAGYDLEKINKAIDAWERSDVEIKNTVGFLRAAIRNNYEAPKAKKATKKEQTSYKSRNIISDPDYEELFFLQRSWENSLTQEEFNEFIKANKATGEVLADFIERVKG